MSLAESIPLTLSIASSYLGTPFQQDSMLRKQRGCSISRKDYHATMVQGAVWPQVQSAFKFRAQQQRCDKEAEMSLLCFPTPKDIPLSKNSASASIIKLGFHQNTYSRRTCQATDKKPEV